MYLSIMLLTLVFAGQQILVLYQREGTTFTTSELVNYQEPGYSFGPENGFRVAFAIIDNSEPSFVHLDQIVKMEMK